MRTRRTLILALLIAMVAAGCSDDDPSADGTGSGGSDSSEETTGAGDAEDAEEAAEPSDEGSGGVSATVSVSDGSTWEFTEILECEIGEDGSPDYREFIGRTADGSAQLDVTYFPESELAALSGVTLAAEVDGNDWTYADSYAGTEDAFDVSLQPDGAEGSATVRVVGIDAPNADLSLDWSFTC